MAFFITRVELQSASSEDYAGLHRAMEAEGFSRTITSDDGVRFDLPTAEYLRVGEVTRDQVLHAAKRAVATTRKAYGILVTESNGFSWDGLAAVTG